MRRLFRRLVYLLLCGQDPRTRISVGARIRIPVPTRIRISVGARIRIPVGTEMRGMRRCGVASRRRRLRHTEPDSLCQRHRFGTRKWCLRHPEHGMLCQRHRIGNQKRCLRHPRLEALCQRHPIGKQKRRLWHTEHGTLCGKRHAPGRNAARDTRNGIRCVKSGTSARDMPLPTRSLRNVVSKAAYGQPKRRLWHTEHRTLC